MKRPLPALQLSRNPLTAVLAQVVISPILKMEEFVPSIQEDLRRNGFPGFRREDTQEIQLGPTPLVRVGSRWIFTDKDNHSAAILTPSALVMQTASYESFDKFTEVSAKVFEIIGKHTDVLIAQRLGLRYVNLIRPSKGKTVNDYLKPGLHGLDDQKLTTKKLASRFEFLGETEVGRLLIRLFHSDNGAILPPDLDGLNMEYQKVPAGERLAILDLDHFSIKQRDYKVASLIEDFWKLHESTDRAFRESVTATALAEWQSEGK